MSQENFGYLLNIGLILNSYSFFLVVNKDKLLNTHVFSIL